MNPIAATSSIKPVGLAALQNQPTSSKAGSSGFTELVGKFVSETNQSQITSDVAISDMVQGKTDNVQQVVMAMANAELSFQLFMEVRNKLIDSYNELMRMQF